MGPDIPYLVQQMGWPAVTLVFFGWVALRVGRFLAPLVRQLFESHVSMMAALAIHAREQTEIMGKSMEILENCERTGRDNTVTLSGLSEKLDAAI